MAGTPLLPTPRRVLIAFLIAPGAVPALLAIQSATRGFHDDWRLAAVIALFTYGAALVLGLPMYLLFRSRGWLRWWHCVLGGASVAALVVLVGTLRAGGVAGLYWLPAYLLIGAVSGVLFWLVALSGGARAR